MNRNIKVITVSGFPISLNYTWFVIFGLLTWNLAAGYFPLAYPHRSLGVYWLIGTLASMTLFLSVLLHELSHSLIARRNGMEIKEISLYFFGGVARFSGEPPDPRTEFRVAMAGPLSSLSLGILFLLLSMPLEVVWGDTIFFGFFRYLYTINFVLAIFNLFPGFPLDGGRILRAYLWAQRGDQGRATYLATLMGKMFALSLILMGIYLTVAGNLAGLWWIFIGLFLRQAAESSYQQVFLREKLSGLQVRDLMTSEVITLEPSSTIESAVNNFFLRYHHRSFPVTENRRLLGILSLKEIKGIPREDWPVRRVEEAMERVTKEMILHPDMQAVDALRVMIVEGKGRLPVVGHGDTIVGILTRRDMMDLLKIKTDLAT